MLSSFDDYPVHQVAEPVAHPGTTDRNFYERYWLNGIGKDGQLFFGAALGIYPNRQVMDASFSVLLGKQQHSLHASRRAPVERAELRVGPLALEIIKPMRELRLVVQPNQTGMEADLLFRARTLAHEEPRSHFAEDNRPILDTCRFVQYGTWEGWAAAGGTRFEVTASQVLGTRDRSWGVRPIGEPVRGAPPRKEPGIYWIWSALHFEEMCVHFYTLEDHAGHTLEVHAVALPTSSVESSARPLKPVAHAISWQRGTRWSAAATMVFETLAGERLELTLEPLSRFHMKGLGYQHPEWGHGLWKGEEVLAGESWNVDELEPHALENLHIHQICHVRMGDRTGVGTFEQVVIGSHQPSGFRGISDGAA